MIRKVINVGNQNAKGAYHPRLRSKYWEDMVEIVDLMFPKGKCKERGQALVMLAYIELIVMGKKHLIDKLF